MASAYLDSTTGELVPAVPGRIIRVRRLIISTDANGWFQLKHGGEGDVTHKFYMRVGGASTIDLQYERDTPQTPHGASLGLDTNVLMSSYCVYVEYELVD